jgi:hypothetical protein
MSKINPIILSDIETISDDETISEDEYSEKDEQVYFLSFFINLILLRFNIII